MKQPFFIHSHTEFSNFRLKDSINKTTELLDTAVELGLDGVCISDHETIAAHIKAYRYMKDNPEKFKDFTIGYGNEVYLVDEDIIGQAREKNLPTKYYHFILLAKNQDGHKALRRLSSQAWEDAFYHRGVQRVPLYKKHLKRIMNDHKGNVIASSACIGGELPQLLLTANGIRDDFDKNTEPISDEEMIRAQKKADELTGFLLDIFGDDFYIELQPSHRQIQKQANKFLYDHAKKYGIKPIITTDAHYLRKHNYPTQEMYLKSQNGEREVFDFYATTYLMDREELLEFMNEELLDELIENTHEIKNKLEKIEFGGPIQIPKSHIPEFELCNEFECFYDDYEYIKKFAHSDHVEDRYYLQLIIDGFKNKNIEITEERIDRVNTEMREIWLLSELFEQPMSSYFLHVKEIVDIIWQISLVGPSRGSACCYYTNYLLDIVQIDAIKYSLPHWRFLSVERGSSLPDIDIDVQGDKRGEVIDLIRETYGYDNVLMIGTFGKEKTVSAVQTMCRGYSTDEHPSISPSTAQNMTAVLEDDLYTSYYGDEEEGVKPNQEFIKRIDVYDGLFQASLEIEDLIQGRGMHAAGVVIFNRGYIEEGNAMMRTTEGLRVTQTDMYDTEFLGGLKVDILSVTVLTTIRKTMDYLLEAGEIEWQGDLKSTYNKYLHPDVLDLTSPEMYQMLYNGEVHKVFQFSTNVGEQAIRTVQAKSFDDLAAANGLMRLSIQGEKQPIDKFAEFGEDITLWYDEMRENGLNEEEMEVLKGYLLEDNGICSTQESLMELSMCPKISNYDLKEANFLRKLVANQDEEELRNEYQHFMTKGREAGTRDEMLNYVWKYCFSIQFGYAFSKPHLVGYTFIAFQQMNLCYRYDPIYWQTANLTIDSGILNEKNPNYGELGKTLGEMAGVVIAPDINKSTREFTPFKEAGKILFGIEPIKGLNKKNKDSIFKNRPFKDFDDFLERMYDTGEFTLKKTVVLIKSGCFDLIEPDITRRELMVRFLDRIVPLRDNLNLSSVPFFIENEIIDIEKYKEELTLYSFRRGLMREKWIPTEVMEEFFRENYIEFVEYDYDKQGRLIIDKDSFNKYYEQQIKPVREYITSPKAAEDFRRVTLRNMWIEECLGTEESWEMETIGFYTKRHDFDNIPIDKYFDLKNFYELPEEPKPFSSGYGYENVEIGGTVVDKVKDKSIIYLNTQYGVVTVKLWRNVYNKYDEKIGDENSWFERGSKLVLIGYRRGEQFFIDNRNSIFNQSIYKINGYNDEYVSFLNDR